MLREMGCDTKSMLLHFNEKLILVAHIEGDFQVPH